MKDKEKLHRQFYGRKKCPRFEKNKVWGKNGRQSHYELARQENAKDLMVSKAVRHSLRVDARKDKELAILLAMASVGRGLYRRTFFGYKEAGVGDFQIMRQAARVRPNGEYL